MSDEEDQTEDDLEMDDSFDEDGLDDEPSFDDFGQENTIGDLWRNNPLVKVGVIFVGGAIIFGTILMLGGEKEAKSPSYVPAGPEVTSTPGTEETSPKYVDAINEYNENQVEIATKTGESALPIPVEPPVGQIPTESNRSDEEDPLQRWRRLQEERRQESNTQAEIDNSAEIEAQQAANSARNDAIQAMADVMSQQMQSVLENQSGPVSVATLQVTDPRIFDPPPEDEDGNGGSGGASGSSNNGSNGNSNEDESAQIILIPAGEIEYAQLITEANSDSPGPVLAQIASGPLIGSRLLGSFEKQNEVLTLSFNTIVIDGIATSVDAVALDPDTTLPGLATEVDRRIFQRVILPMAAEFVQGAAQAVADSGRLTVTIQGETVSEQSEDANTDQEIASGIEEAGEELSDILEEMGGTIEVLVRIESGTPMGILFLQPVVQESSI